jgi:hypothetical protein
MALQWPNKDPDEVLDYQIDWADRLDGDTISTSTWVIPSGITQGAASKTDTTVTTWLSGGTLGASYTLLNRVVTAAGRTMDQSVRIRIAAK